MALSTPSFFNPFPVESVNKFVKDFANASSEFTKLVAAAAKAAASPVFTPGGLQQAGLHGFLYVGRYVGVAIVCSGGLLGGLLYKALTRRAEQQAPAQLAAAQAAEAVAAQAQQLQIQLMQLMQQQLGQQQLQQQLQQQQLEREQIEGHTPQSASAS